MQDLCEPGLLMEMTMELAGRLAQAPRLHMALVKQSVLRGLNREPWDSALMESWGQSKAFGSTEFQEGIKAFREKRSPRF